MGASWKGSISFGLIYIPIRLQVAASEEKIGFNMLHDACKSRIRYKKVCDYCDIEVKHQDIVKGYNYADDKYVIMEDDDFEKIKSERDKTINIVQFVEQNEIDSIFYEKSYYVVPEGGEKPFELLKKALSETNKVGIAKTVLGSRESLVALRMSENKLVLNTLFFLDEIRDVQLPFKEIDVNKGEVDLAKQLIQNMTAPFRPEHFHDEYKEKLKAAIEQKIAGKEISIPQEQEDHSIINLMDALQESIRNTERPHS